MNLIFTAYINCTGVFGNVKIKLLSIKASSSRVLVCCMLVHGHGLLRPEWNWAIVNENLLHLCFSCYFKVKCPSWKRTIRSSTLTWNIDSVKNVTHTIWNFFATLNLSLYYISFFSLQFLFFISLWVALLKAFYLVPHPVGAIASPRRATHAQTLLFGKSLENRCPSGNWFASLVHALYFDSSCLGRWGEGELSRSRLTRWNAE